MEQKKIDRINELARRVKAGETLTDEELAERDALRREYIASVKASLTGQLDNTYIVGPDGTKHKLSQKRGAGPHSTSPSCSEAARREQAQRDKK